MVSAVWYFSTTPALPVAKYPTCVVAPLVVHLDLQISPRVFEMILMLFFKGLGTDESWKKPKAKNSGHCPFNPFSRHLISWLVTVWMWCTSSHKSVLWSGMVVAFDYINSISNTAVFIWLWTYILDCFKKIPLPGNNCFGPFRTVDPQRLSSIGKKSPKGDDL